MDSTTLPQVKKAWHMPVLIVHGNVQDITQQTSKWFGSSDGVVLDPDHGGPIPGVPIGGPS
jgi:hypothetical protein